MKVLASIVLVAAVCIATVMPLSAADDKQLQNHKGDVYQQGPEPNATPQPVALNATVAIKEQDYAGAGANSQGWILLPDSSQIWIGQNTKVQMKQFDTAARSFDENRRAGRRPCAIRLVPR